ncbi:unnamed protein product [Psylliodes chrysocephalus]|uniref:Uncharacterized protein n=1 Tax=Psylliodes chrysocephalus TaxID=3402493 RepID=A0A9P0CZ83_9CUCU|nr:unnamed protein product [Psylliodes chrysocephala]
MRQIVLVLFFISCAYAQDDFGSTGVRVAIKIYDDCSKSNDFMRCLKMKAVTLIERFGRMDSLALANGVVVMRTPDAPKDEPELTEEQIDQTLERSSDAKDATLNKLLMEKISHFIGSRSIQVTLPKISVSKLIEEGRKGDFDFGFGGHGHEKKGKGKGKKKGHDKGGLMKGMMMSIAAKMIGQIPLFIFGLLILAKKALISAKIALLISGIIALSKLLASKRSGGGGGHGGGGSTIVEYGAGGGWQQGGGGGGWQYGGGGGGWDRAQNLAYKAQIPKVN